MKTMTDYEVMRQLIERVEALEAKVSLLERYSRRIGIGQEPPAYKTGTCFICGQDHGGLGHPFMDRS